MTDNVQQKTSEPKMNAYQFPMNIYAELRKLTSDAISFKDVQEVRSLLRLSMEEGDLCPDAFGLDPVYTSLGTALLLVKEIAISRSMLLANMFLGLQ